MLQDEHKTTPLPHKIWTTGTWPKEYFIQEGKLRVNPTAMGNAWLVRSIKKVKTLYQKLCYALGWRRRRIAYGV